MLLTIKRIYLLKTHLFVACLVPGFLLLLTGCNTRIEGCLDIAAANFDLNADRACEDCCTYPSLSISLSQKWNDRNFRTNDTLTDINHIDYRILDLKFFLSSWRWFDNDLITYTVDSAEIACNGSILHYTPDIILVDTAQFVYTLGTIRESPLIDSVELNFGLLSALDCIDATAISTPVILSDESPLWDHQLASRAALRIIFQKDLSIETFDTVYIHTRRDMSLGYDLEFRARLPASLNLSVNYALWFSNVDIQDPASIESSILAGIPGSIFKTP